jgi:type I restriction enzyme, S subunit
MVVNESIGEQMVRVSPSVGDLPKTWSWGCLDDLCEGVYDCPHSTPKLTATGPYVARTQDVLTGVFITVSAAHVSDDTYYERTKRAVPRRGDLLYSREGTYFGNAAEVPSRIKVCLGQRMVLIRPDKATVDFCFLRYWLNSPVMGAYIHGFRDGSVAERLNLPTIRSLPVLIPPLPEQRKIASVLGALDDKIAVNEEVLRISCDLMGFEYENSILSGVKATTIGAIADVFDGPHATPKKTESGPWFLSISSLRNGRLVLEESAHLAEPDFEKWTRRVTPTTGDVLFSYETRLGEAALMPTGIRACLGRRMALMRPRGVGPRTLLQAFLNESFQETIKQYSVHGATVDRIPLSEFPSWQIGLPTHEPQQLEYVLRHLDELAEQRERENETLAGIRDALLPRLMSGEIRVRDAEKVVEDVT